MKWLILILLLTGCEFQADKMRACANMCPTGVLSYTPKNNVESACICRDPCAKVPQ